MPPMNQPQNLPAKPVERLFPFLVRARKLIIGRETLARSKRELHCILIATDISDASKEQLLREFKDYPVLQRYTSLEFESFFGARNAKVIGFKKSSLAKSIYAELKDCRVNSAAPAPKQTGGS
jgi:hypothetical protein